ncbi:MAG: NrpR regulatory domain-containing protein [Thermodesulfobacteriota bacterium]
MEENLPDGDGSAVEGTVGLVIMGDTSEPVCEIPVDLNKMGMVLLGGLNPVAAAEEAGIETTNLAMSTVMDYQALVEFREAVIDYRDLLRFREVAK